LSEAADLGEFDGKIDRAAARPLAPSLPSGDVACRSKTECLRWFGRLGQFRVHGLRVVAGHFGNRSNEVLVNATLREIELRRQPL